LQSTGESSPALHRSVDKNKIKSVSTSVLIGPRGARDPRPADARSSDRRASSILEGCPRTRHIQEESKKKNSVQPLVSPSSTSVVCRRSLVGVVSRRANQITNSFFLLKQKVQTGRLETPESRERARAPDEDLVVTSRARNFGACPKDLEKKNDRFSRPPFDRRPSSPSSRRRESSLVVEKKKRGGIVLESWPGARGARARATSRRARRWSCIAGLGGRGVRDRVMINHPRHFDPNRKKNPARAAVRKNPPS